ncbi:MAG: hypothetical protein ACRET4_03245 [Steroidobacteraceae bacterium]
MTPALRLAKAMLPDRVGKALRRRHRAWVFEHAMRRFLADPVNSWQKGPELIPALIYGWGNETFSAREDYLHACLRHALVYNTSILECGSGLTTVLVGALLDKTGGFLCSLEHNAAWCERVQAALDRYQIGSVQLLYAPLASFGDYAWYGAPWEALPSTISMVICDGPPAGTPGGRYGAIPLMRDRLRRGAVVLLDDAGRAEERAIAARWATELGSGVEIHGEEKPYARIAV